MVSWPQSAGGGERATELLKTKWNNQATPPTPTTNRGTHTKSGILLSRLAAQFELICSAVAQSTLPPIVARQGTTAAWLRSTDLRVRAPRESNLTEYYHKAKQQRQQHRLRQALRNTVADFTERSHDRGKVSGA